MDQRPPSPRPSPPGEGVSVVANISSDDVVVNPVPRNSPRRGNNFSLSSGERAGVRAGVLPFKFPSPIHVFRHREPAVNTKLCRI